MMPTYDYICPKCDHWEEIFHMMSDETPRPCPECNTAMVKQLGTGYIASKGFKPTLEDLKEEDHRKKVKDPERARRKRIKEFGSQAVGDPVDKPDPKHIVKRGRALGGQQKEVDKQEFIKAAAKDEGMVRAAKKALKESKKK
jgi:putative FmdB family regulatory protein